MQWLVQPPALADADTTHTAAGSSKAATPRARLASAAGSVLRLPRGLSASAAAGMAHLRTKLGGLACMARPAVAE